MLFYSLQSKHQKAGYIFVQIVMQVIEFRRIKGFNIIQQLCTKTDNVKHYKIG